MLANHRQSARSPLDRRRDMIDNTCNQILLYRKTDTSGSFNSRVDVNDEDSDSSVANTFSSTTTRLKNSNERLRKENKHLRQTNDERNEAIAKLRSQQQQEERQDRQNHAASSFAKNRTILISLGNVENLAENTRKANQQAKDYVGGKKASDRQTQQDRYRWNEKRSRNEDVNENPPQNPPNQRTATGQPPKKKRKKKKRQTTETTASTKFTMDDEDDLFVGSGNSPRDHASEVGTPLQQPKTHQIDLVHRGQAYHYKVM